MNLTAIRNPDNWQRRASVLRKQWTGAFRKPCDSRAVFVLGKQRSGTTMLMHAFHRHPDMLVFDEHLNNKAFDEHRLRSLDVIHDLVEQSRFAGVCFKPICDSHRIGELRDAFPDGRFIWMYRDYRDVAASSLRKFEHSVRAIRLVCTGRKGGGWFQEGISPSVARMLKEVYRPGLTDFDLACLTWWARNRIVIDSGLAGGPGVTVVKYEGLVSRPGPVLEWLFQRIGIGFREGVARHISPRSAGRHPSPALDSAVQSLCAEALISLDDAWRAGNPPVPSG